MGDGDFFNITTQLHRNTTICFGTYSLGSRYRKLNISDVSQNNCLIARQGKNNTRAYLLGGQFSRCTATETPQGFCMVRALVPCVKTENLYN